MNSHKIKDVFMWSLREHLLEVWKIPLVGGLSNKLISEDMIVPHDFWKGGIKNKQTGVIKFGYIIMLVGREKCWFQYVPLHQEE